VDVHRHAKKGIQEAEFDRSSLLRVEKIDFEVPPIGR
jgi:hypothetical protein